MIRILLAVDDPDSAQDVQNRLQPMSYDVLTASADEVTKRVDELRPDIILMDVRLKRETDWIEVAQQIKSRHNIPIILITPNADEATVRRAITAEPDGFLIKPLDALELRAAIEIALRGHGMNAKAHETARRIRELTESLSEVIFETDMVGNLTFVNRAGLQEFGYTKEQVEGGMTLYDFVPPDKHEEIRESIAQAVIDEPSPWIEAPGLRRDGSTFPISVRASVIVREGVPVGMRGIALNVTEQKRAEQKLEQSERRIREITDALPVVVYETDATGRMTFANATAFDMFGYTKEEFEAGMSLFQVVTDADKERARAVFHRRTSFDDVGRADYTGLRKDGSTFPVSALGAPIRRDGAVVGVRGIAVDNTERKRAEEGVKERTHTIEALNRIMAEGTRATHVQSFAETVTNLTLELLHFDVGTIHLHDYNALRANLCYATGIPDIAVEAIRNVPLDDPAYARVLIEGKPLFVDGHEALRVPHAAELGLKSLAVVPLYRYDTRIGALNVGSFTRHTFSQAEKELLIAIGNEVGVVIAKLQADELIRITLKEKETLLKEIHHRVKNNMQVISSLISLQAQQATEPETVEMLKESQSRIRSMALIHEKLYRSDSLAEISFRDYVDSMVDELLGMFNVAPGAITITTDVENVLFGVDTAIPCALIINELVSNSLKHAFPDGAPGEVTIALHQINGTCELTVADNGVGPPPNFDFRATDSLGMQLVTALTNQLDGTITLDRTKGTTFIITFTQAGARIGKSGRE